MLHEGLNKHSWKTIKYAIDKQLKQISRVTVIMQKWGTLVNLESAVNL